MPSTTRHRDLHFFRNNRAFTSVQLCLVLLCTLLLTGLVTGLAQRHRSHARCEAFIEEIEAFARGLRASKLVQGGDFAAPDKRWHEETPFGGNYLWISPYPPSSDIAADKNLLGAILVSGFPPRSEVRFSRDELDYLQARLGEKPLPGVKFGTGFNGWPLCLVYSSP